MFLVNPDTYLVDPGTYLVDPGTYLVEEKPKCGPPKLKRIVLALGVCGVCLGCAIRLGVPQLAGKKILVKNKKYFIIGSIAILILQIQQLCKCLTSEMWSSCISLVLQLQMPYV